MRVTKVDIDHAGIIELAHDPRMTDLLMPAAEACRDTAILTAPVYRHTYQRSMFVGKLRRGARAGVFYGSSDTKAMLMEYGSKNNRAFHTLRNAALAHRLHVVETVRR
jgi:hypothetical protein